MSNMVDINMIKFLSFYTVKVMSNGANLILQLLLREE
jgi:hypothetical protein